MAYQTTITLTDSDEAFLSASAKTIISATQVIGVSTHRSQTIGYVNAVGNLNAPRPEGFGKIEWTADGQPSNAYPYDTVVRIDELV